MKPAKTSAWADEERGVPRDSRAYSGRIFGTAEARYLNPTDFAELSRALNGVDYGCSPPMASVEETAKP